MKLEDKLNKSIIESMKSKNVIRLESLRSIKSALILLKTKHRNSLISEIEEIQMLQKLVKQRKESSSIFKDQNRIDLAEQEDTQAKIISEFLPKQLSREEIENIIVKIIIQTQASSMKDMGKVMSEASIKLAGKADGKTISIIVREKLTKT
ncbi:MAG: glutamyl-tRNA amidotransferase [Flavobacteriaceae bacterium TMED116]|nr:MAG: glutamyl-tRNA amidotransferase [Flavobacteriaceae bacterium TMED116]